MIEQRPFPYGGVPVYNPLSLSKDEALLQFHARQAAYQSLMNVLREERPSHVLIIGTRGMGKTTLLQRVRYGVEDDAELNGRYLVLAFPEEQYNVNRLHRFLLNAVDALADAMDRLGNKPLLERVEKYVDEVGKRSPEEIEEQVPQFLAEISGRMQKGLLLLVDNADRLFETIEDRQQWRLRDLLSSRRDLTFFGATTQASEGIYGPERAFFEFFKIYQLAPLTFTEVRELLIRLSESVEGNEDEKGAAKRRVTEWLDADKARLQTLVQLTGGNPRTTVLLFHLVLDGLTGGAREYLEQLLDQVTPTYKGRVDELPAQAQQVLDAVALRWDPVVAVEVAEDTGLETSAVSAQLTRLVRQGILEKADPGDSRKAMYQVAERFFNIWYLMRASRRVRAKLRWFVEFLRVFFDSGELEKMAWERIERSKGAWRGHPEEIGTAFAYLLASGANRGRVEHYLRQECAGMEPDWLPYLELLTGAIGGSVAVANSANTPLTSRPLGDRSHPPGETTAAIRRAAELHPESALPWMKLVELSRNSSEGKTVVTEGDLKKVLESEPNPADYLASLGDLIKRAIEVEPDSAWLWGVLAGLLENVPARHEEAELACRKAIQLDPTFTAPWGILGRILARVPARSGEAEPILRRAIELDPSSAAVWAALGTVLAQTPNQGAGSEAAFRKALELNPNSFAVWAALGFVLAQAPNRGVECEAALRKALELNSNAAPIWAMLGLVLAAAPSRSAEAESTLQKAIDLDATSEAAWAGLGAVLARIPNRTEDAVTAYRNAVELSPGTASYWNDLGNLLARTSERAADAEAACRKAVELDPKNAMFWGSLGFVLACHAGRPKDAEVAFRNSIRLSPDNTRDIRNLGVLLYCELGEPKESAVNLGLAHKLRPDDPVSAAIFAASLDDSGTTHERISASIDAARTPEFWDELLGLCQNYAPFGKILRGICDLVQERDNSNRFVRLYRAVALAQLRDFPRASVALEDALTGDPIDLLRIGQEALVTFLAAAVKSERVRDCIDLIDKKDWKDAWRPIYEALQAVEAGSAEYLKRTAVEIRTPALLILRRIAPQLPDLPERASGG